MQSSTYTVEHTQKDGRAYVFERHVDAAGIVREFAYLAAAGANYAANLATHAAMLDAMLAQQEFEDAIQSAANIIPVYQTAAQFADRLRARYRDSSEIECGRLATWLYNHYVSGNFTALQLRTAFGMTTTQFNTFVTKVQTLRTNYLAVLAARGE
jgi:hypothetical protein